MKQEIAAPQFKIPIELLKAFQSDVRFVPNVLPTNGWMIFDIGMLTSVLRRGDPKAGAALADQLEELTRSKAHLVIVAEPTEQLR